ncbi:penicillin-binding transpeptidase domain-containing protein [Massilia polaris]|uniref:penicillin-binding transpeptidase domain-containing protein n=1 Tax=Massilia polaris TaxID=2728846 RepID=UPI001E5C6A74|nr:penicillin-binding transpeptidase domain-containing protein [Massilia polaris]
MPSPSPVQWIAAAGCIAAFGGAMVIAGHARQLALSTDARSSAADIFQPVMPAAAFSVPASPGITFQHAAAGAFLVSSGMRAAPAVVVDLCTQAAGRRLLPVRAGYHFADVARWAARNEAQPGAVSLRHVALAAPDVTDMPRLTVTGSIGADKLQVEWEGRGPVVRWLSDASGGRVSEGARGKGALLREGWLAWGGGAALRIQRRTNRACPEAGDLVMQVFRPDGIRADKAIVHAFPMEGQPVSAWMRPGEYRVSTAPSPRLEDQQLFQGLAERGLVRLGAGGIAELAPRDLAAWRAASGGARAVELPAWRQVPQDEHAQALLERLYRMADGAFVREQVRIFNSERRLLAWRVRPVSAHGDCQANVGNAAAPTTGAMPLAASRLFAELPQGWAPWTRIARWPQAAGAARAQVTLALPQPAAGGERLQLLLAGRVLSVDGASMRAHPAPACTGRACPSADAVQLLDLELTPGARSISIHATPIEMGALAAPADQKYRHLRVEGGRLAWHALLQDEGAQRRAASADVRLEDRNGTVLWSGGSPTPAAIDAGLAPLLGMRSDHPNSVAGMLARLPASGGMHNARLSIDLALQASSQAVLDCLGMRRGRWDGARCHGGEPVPHGRQAGMVVLDAETGDVLAAAGAGAGAVTAANWDEVRDFDRTNPARSALRLPAFQHDGGVHRSPGSTFKVVSALGLELAARRDPQIAALLAGLPLDAINQMAARKGYAFQTNAATYPFQTRQAHITNFRDQHLDRRAHDGRLGLAQALTYSLNTWFAWSGELADRSLFGRPEGGAPDLHPLEPGALDSIRPVMGMARQLGFGKAWRLDGGLLPPEYPWSQWDALQASAARVDPVHTRHELRQMAIGLRMQATPLQMALVSAAVGQGGLAAPRLLLALDGREAAVSKPEPLGVRLDRVRAGMKGVIDSGTAAAAFSAPQLAHIRAGLSGKTGTAPTIGDRSTVWFTGWLEPGTLPNQPRRLAISAFISHSEATGGGHAAPVVAAVLASMERARQ